MRRIIIAMLLIMISQSMARAQFTNQFVISSTDQAPGFTAGITYREFFAPTINANGQLLIAGSPITGGNNSAIWVGNPGNIQLVARTGDPVPGAPGLTFASTYFNSALNDNGQVGFFAELTGTSFPNNRAIIMGSPGAVQTIARPPLPAAGQPPGVNYSQLFSLTSFSNAGTLYSAVLSGTPNNNATFAGGGTVPLGTIFQINQPAPGIPGALLNFRQILNYTNSGRVALHSSTTVGGSAGPTGIWLGLPNSLTLVATTGATAPGVAGATFSTLNIPWSSPSGQTLAFTGVMTGAGFNAFNNSGLWLGAPGALTLIARQGNQAAGFAPGITHDTIVTATNIRYSNVGVALDGFVTGPGISSTNNEALWISNGTTMNLVARESQQMPGGPVGVLFGPFNPGNNMSMNSNGYLAFQATLTGTGVTSSNNDSLWIGGPDGQLIFIARTGDTINVGNLGLRTINGISISPDGMGDRSELAWKADFTDGTSAIFITSVPEPGTIALGVGSVGAALAAFLWRRQKRLNSLNAEVQRDEV